MKPFKLKIEKTITNDQVAGILCTSFEGSMTVCWARMVGKTKPTKRAKFEGDWLEYPQYSYPLGTGGSVTLEDTETGKKYKLNRASIARGIKVMAEKYPRHFTDFMEENDDAITGDVFVQCCLFGDAIYG